MNARTLTLLASLLLATVATLHAGPRASANYSITAEITDAGGLRTASANYANVGSAGVIGGISTVAVPAEIAKHGYIGQLFEVTALVVNAAAPTVNEGASVQLGAWQLLDDDSFLAVAPLNVIWSPAVSPIALIDVEGLATAEIVYQDTPATVGGTFGGFTGMFNLTVVNVNFDDFGTYAGDGVGDDWQVQYFGLDNPDAAPGLDPDSDGQSNGFEYLAGLVPTDPASLFRLRIERVPGQPAQKDLIFSPRFEDRTYTIEYRLSLTAGQWDPLGGTSFIDDADTRTVTDPSATDATRFYRVQITQP